MCTQMGKRLISDGNGLGFCMSIFVIDLQAILALICVRPDFFYYMFYGPAALI